MGNPFWCITHCSGSITDCFKFTTLAASHKQCFSNHSIIEYCDANRLGLGESLKPQNIWQAEKGSITKLASCFSRGQPGQEVLSLPQTVGARAVFVLFCKVCHSNSMSPLQWAPRVRGSKESVKQDPRFTYKDTSLLKNSFQSSMCTHLLANS